MVQYALILKSPTHLIFNDFNQLAEKNISFEGLKTLEPDMLSISALAQQLRVSGNKKDINYSGDLLSVGNVGRGSWYADINQANMEKLESWQLRELQYFWKTDENDYVIGSQPTFWQNKISGDFWGVTLLNRSGFKTVQTSAGGFDPFYRRTTSVVGRTITGEAKPNTLVRLVRRMSNQIIAEVFVNSSGIYTFNDVEMNPVSTVDYEILFYPNGILTVEPERETARFVSRASQLQQGASTFMISSGVSRSTGFGNDKNNFWGKATDFTGEASYRYGLFESLTLGGGWFINKAGNR